MIHLPKPCPVKWDSMTPTEGGRDCSVCQKVIPDFSGKTEAEIIAAFENGFTCGSFTADQVTDGSTYGGWKHFFNWKSAIAMLLMGSVFLASCHRRTSGFYAPPKKKFKLSLKDKKNKRQVTARFLLQENHLESTSDHTPDSE